MEIQTVYAEQFTVFPEDSNHLTPLIFGGAFMAKMDRVAATCLRNFLRSFDRPETPRHAVTYKFDVTFSGPSNVGEEIKVVAMIDEAHGKTVAGTVLATRINEDGTGDRLAEVKFVFVTIDDPRKSGAIQERPKKLPYKEHGIKYSVHRVAQL
jgi:acyl-CoA hydrolase